ncbi:MAG: hypothetical protein JSV20_01100 [Candidatus Bathyarchaeota archaeon]|nr:MAG: hypothetical protein JSV20_01100 [Candidatus Bathyarchaeota archaeon]
MVEAKAKEEKGIVLRIFEAYRGLNQNVWYVLFLAMVIIPMVYPLALPIGISQYTRDFKAAIDRSKDGGRALISINYCTGGEGPGLPAMVDTIKYLVTRKQMTIVNVGILMPVVGQLAENVFAKVPWDSYGYVYGVDYVNLGFIIGQEAAVAAIATDFKTVIKQDYRGNPASALPILDDIYGIDDFDLVVEGTDYSGQLHMVIRQWPSTPDRPLVTHVFAGTALPFYPGSVDGFVDTAGAGPAEFEVLAGIPGTAVINSDVISLSQLFLLIVVLMANISYWIVRSLGGKT